MSSNLNKCQRCTKIIYSADKYENYEGKIYHSGCFKCSNDECQIRLTTRTVKGYNKIPYCQKHVPNQSINQLKEDERPSIDVRCPILNQSTYHFETNEHPYVNISDLTSNQQTISIEEKDERPPLDPRIPISNQLRSNEEHPYVNVPDLTSNQQTISIEEKDERPPLDPRIPISNQSIHYLKEGEEEHIYLNVDNNDNEEELNRFNDKSIRKQIKNVLKGPSETMIDDIFTDLSNNMNIIVCGSPRVGKSTLINAICGVELARAEEGIESITKSIDCYTKQGQINTGSKIINYQYNIWDTPGFESWENKFLKDKIKEILSKPETKPVCMIFCASPGTFVNTDQLEWLLDLCINEKHIFCALVCTNKYSGQTKSVNAVLNVFNRLLSKYIDQPTKQTNEITFFGTIGLTALVNSEPYK